MNYTVKITDTGKKARSLVNMLKELDKRYKYALKNPEEGKSWLEVKANLLMK